MIIVTKTCLILSLTSYNTVKKNYNYNMIKYIRKDITIVIFFLIYKCFQNKKGELNNTHDFIT